MRRAAARNARSARRWEHRVYLGAHPAVYPLLTGIGKLAPAVRIPGVGVLVSSASLAREVLTDTERFVKNGPGSSGALWTPVLGPSVLLNMEGEEHRALRAKLAGLFTPAAATAVCEAVLGPILDDLGARLRSGATVDVVRPTKVAAARIIAELIGFPIPDGPDADRTCLELFAAGEQIVAMVKLTTRQLNPDQVASAKRVLGRLVAPAEAAYRAGDPRTAMGRMAELGLSRDEALGAAAAFFLTGTETVTTTVPRLIAALCDYGLADGIGAAGSSAADGAPPWLDLAIDEAMRVMAPTPAMLRSVVAEARVGNVRVRPGDRIVIATVNCTRSAGPFDPAAIVAGHRPGADLKRLWFGAGPHHCIGAPLALAEIRALARVVLAYAPLRVERRRIARNVLIPSYRLLEVRRA